MASASPEGQPLDDRAALSSIFGFWLFYYAVVTLRAAALGFENQLGMLGRRAVVTLACIAITCAIWRLLRSVANAGIPRQIGLAAIAAVPAAFLYAAVNHYAFDLPSEDHQPQQIVIVRKHSGANGDRQSQVVIRDENEGVNVSIGGQQEHSFTPMTMIADQAANGYFFFVAWAALYLALSYAAMVRSAERRAAEFRAAAQSAELRALRYQVNPHFLFNTLNSLSSLVLADRPDEAERMIMNLSTFFRTSLAGDPTEDVPLREELRLQQLYLEIEKVRFPERLKVEIDVPDGLLDACVPGLILQPLVENAIKHGVSGARRTVTIRISARERNRCIILKVEDDGQAAEAAADGHGVGLSNVRARLAARFGREADVSWGPGPQGGFVVSLFLPLVRHGR